MTNAQFDVEILGQVFTPKETVENMIGLCKNRTEQDWKVLEPSCGNGAFFKEIEGCIGVEIDPNHCPSGAILADFFDYQPEEPLDTIIGNPPFVRYQDIYPSTRAKLPTDRFDERTNLYVFFIDRCIDMLRDGGELVFINPRDFFKSTSARVLNEKLMAMGTITHVEDLGDQRIFAGYTPNCVIWRFVKGDMSHRTDDGREVVLSGGHISFVRSSYPYRLSDFFDVKVGGVSGADKLYTVPEGHSSPHAVDFVCSKTFDTGECRKMFYADGEKSAPPELMTHETELRGRRIKKFGDDNWWHWGRKTPVDDRPRIYVNNKTRRPRPFFLHQATHFDGSVLALMARDPSMDLQGLCDALNDVDWEEIGFVSGNRYLFAQRSLMNAPLPASFGKFLPTAQAAE